MQSLIPQVFIFWCRIDVNDICITVCPSQKQFCSTYSQSHPLLLASLASLICMFCNSLQNLGFSMSESELLIWMRKLESSTNNMNLLPLFTFWAPFLFIKQNLEYLRPCISHELLAALNIWDHRIFEVITLYAHHNSLHSKEFRPSHYVWVIYGL